ncbi:MAG: hypothetical protein AB7I50_03665 [Vicinamibacterales bacterium]
MTRCGSRTCARWNWRSLIRVGQAGIEFEGKWYCSATCLEADVQAALVEARHFDEWVTPLSVPVGRLLVRQRAVSPHAVDAALDAQRRTGRRLGAELVAMRATTRDHVLRALAAQAGVGCVTSVDAARLWEGPGRLSRETVRTLRVVPFDLNEKLNRLAVACTSPLPGFALAAVREMTGYQVLPFLVQEDLLHRLAENYGRACPGLPAGHQVRTVSEAAATVADDARRGLARHMQRVTCSAFTWVRLEGDAFKRDVMVTKQQTEESAWQAAPTSL